MEAIETCDLLKPTSGADRFDVRRLGLAECREAAFHTSSFAWRNAYPEVCEKWTEFLAYCLSSDGRWEPFRTKNFQARSTLRIPELHLN